MEPLAFLSIQILAVLDPWPRYYSASFNSECRGTIETCVITAFVCGTFPVVKYANDDALLLILES